MYLPIRIALIILSIAMLVVKIGVDSPGIKAQNLSSGIANVVELTNPTIPDASIICSTTDGFIACDTPSSPAMFGVISDNPAAFFEVSNVENGRLVLTEGILVVRASTDNGDIASGDFLTSSETPGVAVKATTNGYVLGTALESYNGVGEGLIPVAMNIHPETTLANARSNLLTVLFQGTSAPLLEPLDSLRYLIAALLILIAFTMAFIYFGRMSRTGVEAIGRNPLAGKQIQFNIILHVVLTLGIVIVGLIIAYLVLIL